MSTSLRQCVRCGRNISVPAGDPRSYQCTPGTGCVEAEAWNEIARLREELATAIASADAAEKRVAELEARAAKAEAKAAQYERDWYDAKSEFGDAMAKARERERAAEKRVAELEPKPVARVKCPTCRCMIAEGTTCACCAGSGEEPEPFV